MLRDRVNLLLVLALLAAAGCARLETRGATHESGDHAVSRYLLYDISAGEGFNLRRSALMRAALLTLDLGPGWTLVLPTFPLLPHWSSASGPQVPLPWSRFLDVEKLREVVPVIEYDDFLQLHGPQVDRVLHLESLPFPDPQPKEPILEHRDCARVEDLNWTAVEPDGPWSGSTFGHPRQLRAGALDCRKIFAPYIALAPLVTMDGSRSTLVEHFEKAYWDASYDGEDFWRIRSHLAFAPQLQAEAQMFIGQTFGDEPYLSVHMRRGDFVTVHDVPGLPEVAQQIKGLLARLGLKRVFIASDANAEEIRALHRLLDFEVYRPAATATWLDGEIAIIDQSIAAHGAWFVGTNPSTFSRVIMEEREIMGFASETTWNALCRLPANVTMDYTCPSLPPRHVAIDKSNVSKPKTIADMPDLFVLLAQPPCDPDTQRRDIAELLQSAPWGTQVKAAENVISPAELAHGGKGAWTLSAVLDDLLGALPDKAQWILFASEDVDIDPAQLRKTLDQYDPRSAMWLGTALSDHAPVVIHHYDTPGLAYPDFQRGVILSRGLLEYLHEQVKANNTLTLPRFHIDAAYEFARLVQDLGGPALLDSPAFCSAPSGDSQGQGCALNACAKMTGEDKANLRVEDIVFAVKTWSGNYETRVPVVQKTWARGTSNIIYYSDTTNEDIPTHSTGVPNVTRGFCTKSYAIFRDLEDNHGEHPWFFIADDDTILNVRRVTTALSRLNVPADQPVLVGERYGYGHTNPVSGYDYITMGGGMAMNRAALRELLAADCTCPELTTPDDMWVGLCADRLQIPLVHLAGFHQNQPDTYSPAVLEHSKDISFHRHQPMDPYLIYEQWLGGISSGAPPENAQAPATKDH